MKLKFATAVLAGLGALAGLPGAFGATLTFDFESLAATAVPRTGAYTSLSMTNGGLTMTLSRVSGVGFDIVGNTGGQSGKPAGWGLRSLDPFFNTSVAGDYWIANFSSAILGFSAETGDYGGDNDDPVFMAAHSGLSAAGATIASSSTSWGTSAFPSFASLGVTGTGIMSVTFGSSGAFPNSLFWDNLRVETAPPSVPDSGGVALLVGLGMLALVAGKSRLRR